ncbi:MAG: universal stress protein [Planctomycetales bacterium]|nr:universal stress protein [Planctomycetales bacterium]
MQRFKKILVYVGTNDPLAAIKRAFEIATENKATVTLMDVVKPLPTAIGILTDVATPEEMEKLLIADRVEKLKELADTYSRDSISVDVVVSCGDPAQEITKRVIVGDYDLVIKTADGLSASGRLFGSIARSLLRICPCPVWTLKPQVHGEFDQVLAAIDIDAEDDEHRKLNKDILELAYSIAERDHAQLHVVSVWDLWMEQSLRRRAGDAEVDAALASRQAKVRKDLDAVLQVPFADTSQIKVHLHRGKASETILAVAEKVEADLIVMGTVCRSGVAGFLIGNTAENLLSDVTCSVLAIKPDGFESPVQVNADDPSARPQMLPII